MTQHLCFHNGVLPCVLFEDDHLLVVDKPAGWNTHAPSPYAGEGIYDWLRHRESRWSSLAIIHRLDKETSGVMVFSKTSLANRSLTQQFTQRAVRKKYLFLTDRAVAQNKFAVKSWLVRAGEKYVSRTSQPDGVAAETRFRLLEPDDLKRLQSISDLPFGPAIAKALGAERNRSLAVWEAEPLTGRTHQIRVHAADKGLSVLGDRIYGGTTAARLYLHAAQLTLRHPETGKELTFEAQVKFTADASLCLREAIVEPDQTQSYRLIHGASDGWQGWQMERYGDYLLSQSEESPNEADREKLAHWKQRLGARGVYHKVLRRQVRRASAVEVSPQLVLGQAAPERFTIRENGVQFELSFSQGYSVGVFLDQRDNRRRLLTGHVGAGFELYSSPGQESHFSLESAGEEWLLTDSQIRDRQEALPAVLNTFAYTCGFSVCAAKSGARTTNVDLSKNYLEWGRRNFALNQINPAGHEFIFGDVFDWLRRLGKKQRTFDVVLLDPPTFSQSKLSGAFQVERDYGKLLRAALPLLRPGGVLFASANAADWPPEEFLEAVEGSVGAVGRKILQRHYAPQPPDFPISREEPGYLKAVWMRIR